VTSSLDLITLEEAREAYADGSITLDEFEIVITHAVVERREPPKLKKPKKQLTERQREWRYMVKWALAIATGLQMAALSISGADHLFHHRYLVRGLVETFLITASIELGLAVIGFGIAGLVDERDTPWEGRR
jgi:hypothetical protein